MMINPPNPGQVDASSNPLMKEVRKYFAHPENRKLISGNPHIRDEKERDKALITVCLMLGGAMMYVLWKLQGSSVLPVILAVGLGAALISAFWGFRLLRADRNAPIYEIKALCLDASKDKIIMMYYDHVAKKFENAVLPNSRRFEKYAVINILVRETKVLTVEGLAPKQDSLRLETLMVEAAIKVGNQGVSSGTGQKDKWAEFLVKQQKLEEFRKRADAAASPNVASPTDEAQKQEADALEKQRKAEAEAARKAEEEERQRKAEEARTAALERSRLLAEERRKKEAEAAARFAAVESEIQARREEWKHWDFLDFVMEFGDPERKPLLLENRRPVIPIKEVKMQEDEIPVGASKMGGYPDLPREISYPTLGQVTEDFKDIHREYPPSAMQLIAQFNLEEVAPYDKEQLLPGHGMLYFFWSGELETRDKQPVYQVIYYGGDTKKLVRTKPELPYYEKYFTSPLPTARFRFEEARYEYCVRELEEELGGLYDYYEFFEVHGTKLLGYALGANVDPPETLWNVFQSGYHEGIIWGLYWLTTRDKLEKQAFDDMVFTYDLD